MTKEEKKIYQKKYEIVNKQRIRELRIQRDIKNKEKIRNQQIIYKLKNSEKIKEYNKTWRKNNSEKAKEWVMNNKDKRKIIDKNYKSNNKEKVISYKLKKNYGITLAQYNEMLTNQNNSCLICNTNQNELSKKLVVDHDHLTGKVRGLLCDKCNRGLGHFNDNIETLIQAIKYLGSNKI
jgi:hypothetical protein